MWLARLGKSGQGKLRRDRAGVVLITEQAGIYKERRELIMVYDWKAGSRIKADPQRSGEMFELLAKTEDGLTAETLLEANRPKGTPLHDDYEWDDDVAAESWRLHQSRHFLNSLTVCLFAEGADQPAL